MKNLFPAILAAAVLAVSLTACGSSSSAEASEASADAWKNTSESAAADNNAAAMKESASEESLPSEISSEESEDLNNDTEISVASSIVIDEELAGLLEGAEPAASAAACDGFEDLSWGSAMEDLPEAASTEILRRGVEFAGYYGSAYYNFDAEDRLVMGVYRLNENASLDWVEALKIYLNVKNHLISVYGSPDEVQRTPGPSTIEELIAEGGGAWSEMWAGLSSSEGDRITLTATLQGNGMMEIQFVNMSVRVVNKADAKEQFCEWYFTSNYEDRWTKVSEAMQKASDEISSVPQDGSAGIIQTSSTDDEDSLKAFFSPVENVITEQFRNGMIRNRDPFKYDQMFIESGAQSYLESVDFEIYEEKESYTVYEFTAVLRLEHFDSLSFAEKVSDDGRLTLKGQITEEGGLVSKIYIQAPA